MKDLSSASFIMTWIGLSLVKGFTPQLLRYQTSGSRQESSLFTTTRENYMQYLTLKNVPLNMISTEHFEEHSTHLKSQRMFHENIKTTKNIPTFWENTKRKLVAIAIIPALLGFGFGISSAYADDELAKFAAAGNTVGVDGKCFLTKCPLETAECANDRTCLKGLSCLARCKGGSMCSTGCFAKFGSSHLDGLLQCSVEKNDCVHVPGKENIGWTTDKITDLPGKPLVLFNPASMEGIWYKTMGLDSRYDCFDCQKNSFKVKNDETLEMEAVFRIPRPNFPGYLQSKIEEELKVTDPKGLNRIATMQSQGSMFGLTFWENWYVLGDTKYYKTSPSIPSFPSPQTGLVAGAYASEPGNTGSVNAGSVKMGSKMSSGKMNPKYASESVKYVESVRSESVRQPDLKLIFYTGHTLQGSYKGAFLYSRTHTLSTYDMAAATKLIKDSGLDPSLFCVIRNQCFLNENDSAKTRQQAQQAIIEAKKRETPFWYLGQNFFRATEGIAGELADWFDDPAILSEWLVSQQVKMLQEQPLAVSPFAGLDDWMGDYKENL